MPLGYLNGISSKYAKLLEKDKKKNKANSCRNIECINDY